MNGLIQFLNDNVILVIFLSIMLGYAVGRIRIGGIGLGSAGVLFIALIFGHFGIQIPDIIQDLGLALFVTAVGFSSGPSFFNNFKKNAVAYIVVGIIAICTSALSCIIIINVTNISADLALGLLAGALTTTPGLATAIEATGSDLVSVGYGIAYPFGVIAVVLFVQMIPKILKSDMAIERKHIRDGESSNSKSGNMSFRFDSFGFFSYSLVIVIGIMLGKVEIPLGPDITFSLGISGGPLLVGIICGFLCSRGLHFFSVDAILLKHLREIGLVFFLLGAGVKAGADFVRVLSEQGLSVLLSGAIMTVVPLLCGYLTAAVLFKLSLLNSLGAICGGMTSTPALGTLIRVSDTEDVANSYAATYPFALITIIVVFQLIGAIWG